MNEHIKGLTHASFFCNTPDQFREMTAFYSEKLGFPLQFTLPYDEGVIQYYQSVGFPMNAKPGDVWIAYYKVCDRQFMELFNMGGNFGEEHSAKHVCFIVEDLKVAAKELVEKDVEVWKLPKDYGVPYDLEQEDIPGACGSYVCFIQDPAGNDIELMQYTANSKQLGGS